MPEVFRRATARGVGHTRFGARGTGRREAVDSSSQVLWRGLYLREFCTGRGTRLGGLVPGEAEIRQLHLPRWVVRVEGDDGELRPGHYIYVHSIESRLMMRFMARAL